MYERILLSIIFSLCIINITDIEAQRSFQELIQVIVDKTSPNGITTSITLQSTSNQEIRISQELKNTVLENKKVIAVVVTNEDNCILGVVEQSCILINVKRSDDWKGIIAIQDETKKIGDSIINDINKFFDTDAQYHSVFLHHRDETNVALNTSGVISGRDTVSAVYTMPKEATDSMYEKISALLLSPSIRESGGFYDTARKLATKDNARMSFTMIPHADNSLLQLKLSINYPNAGINSSVIKPLELLETEKITRSDYFSKGFYPLNSLLHVIILGDDFIWKTEPRFVDTELKNGILIPTDLTQSGWIPDQNAENTTGAIYLFGEKTLANNNDLKVMLLSAQSITPEYDESWIIVAIITAGAIGASVFFLRGYKKNS